MRTTIKKWRNSAALRLPAATLARAGLHVNSPVDIHSTEGKLVVSAVQAPDYTLQELLNESLRSRMTLADEDLRWLEADPRGKEIW